MCYFNYKTVLRKSFILRKMTKKKAVIFDFDCTIFPTYYYFNISNNIDISVLDNVYSNLVNYFINNGYNIYIITNAKIEWVYNVLSKYKKLYAKISCIRILSARDLYEDKYCMEDWKNKAFIEYLPKYEFFLSIGDSTFEIDAALHYSNYHNINCFKIIKLMDRPSPTQLYKQILFIYNNIFNIIYKYKHYIEFSNSSTQISN